EAAAGKRFSRREVVAEVGRDALADILGWRAGAEKQNGQCDCLCRLDGMRMVMAHGRLRFRQLERLLLVRRQPADGRDAHGRAVAPAVVGWCSVRMGPFAE